MTDCVCVRVAGKRALLHEVRLDNDGVIPNTICQGY